MFLASVSIKVNRLHTFLGVISQRDHRLLMDFENNKGCVSAILCHSINDTGLHCTSGCSTATAVLSLHKVIPVKG